MTVNTKKVTQRRKVHYDSLDDMLADAQRLASSNARTVGNWTLPQIFQHLAKSIESSIDGTDMKFPWLLKKIFSLLMNKEKMMSQPLKPGFKIPQKGQAQFSPDPSISTEKALASLQAAVQRCRTETTRSEHPAFGELTREEWDKFHLRHAELHMSFAVTD